MLRDGAKPALRTACSRKVERGFRDNVSLQWVQQVAMMFQILSALLLDVPMAAKCLTNIRGVSPNVLLSFDPRGHVDQTGGECPCRSSDRTGAYVHAMSSDHPPSGCVSTLAFSPQDPNDGVSALPDERIPGESGELVDADCRGTFSATRFGSLCVSPSRCIWPVALGNL